MSNTRVLGECVCFCHKNPDKVIHVVSCCAECRHCGNNIANSYIEIHEKECKQEYDAYLERLAEK